MYEQRDIFKTIPDRPSSHCATLTERADGSLLACWYAGTREAAKDVALMGAEFDGTSWSEPWVVHKTPDLPDGNAVLYTAPSGEVRLFFDTIQGEGWSSVLSFQKRSTDGGHTWTEPELFSPKLGLMFRCRTARLTSGRLLLPCYDEWRWRGVCALSDDEGESWRFSGFMEAPPGCIQPAIIERRDGALLALLRTGGEGGVIWQTVSNDGGETWVECAATSLPNPNAGIDMIRCTKGPLLLAFNNSPTSRTPLDLALSDDEGETWHVARTVESAPDGEFSYPTLMQASDGLCHLLYTWCRKRIRHVSFRLADLKQ